jgi:hypothetical protein
MREECKARPPAAGNPGDEIRALGHLGVELARDAALGQVVAKKLGRTRLVPRRIDGVETD